MSAPLTDAFRQMMLDRRRGDKPQKLPTPRREYWQVVNWATTPDSGRRRDIRRDYDTRNMWHRRRPPTVHEEFAQFIFPEDVAYDEEMELRKALDKDIAMMIHSFLI